MRVAKTRGLKVDMLRKNSSGKWEVDVRPTGAGGKRVRKQFSTHAEASRFKAFLLGQAAQGLPWNPKQDDRRSFSELISQWYSLHGQALKDGEARLKKLQDIDERLGHPLGIEVTSDRFASYRATRIDSGISLNTANHELMYVKAVFSELARLKKWHHGNPLLSMKPYKLEEVEMAWLDEAQIIRLLKECENSNNQTLLAAVILCLDTGARWGEVAELKVRHFRDGKVSFTSTKNGKVRRIPYQHPYIDEWLRGRRDPLFEYNMGAFRKAVKRAEIELPRGQLTHVCRHTFGASFMRNGGNIRDLQRILDHSSIKTTMRYAHFSPDHLEQAARYSPLVNIGGHKVDSGQKSQKF